MPNLSNFVGAGRFQPQSDVAKLDPRHLARMVGIVAFGLPVVLFIGAGPLDACRQTSISHYYYSPALGTVVIGAVCFIGAFLIAYRGENRWESRLASWAGIAAFGVALFPTVGPGCTELELSARAFVELTRSSEDVVFVLSEVQRVCSEAEMMKDTLCPLFTLNPVSRYLHWMSAAVLFAFLALMSGYIFTRTLEWRHFDQNGQLLWSKLNRNRIYYTCAGVIVVCMVLLSPLGNSIAVAVLGDRHVFYLEGIALWAFGMSWLVKGRMLSKSFLYEQTPDKAVS
ncbi:MAG: hypothetical protein AAFU34_18070 [Pseudomonadota bacterium]